MPLCLCGKLCYQMSDVIARNSVVSRQKAIMRRVSGLFEMYFQIKKYNYLDMPAYIKKEVGLCAI